MEEGDISDMIYDSDCGKKPSEAYKQWYKYDGGDMWCVIIFTALIGVMVGVILVLFVQQNFKAVPQCEYTESYKVCKDVYIWEGRPYVDGHKDYKIEGP
jgi:hypothetical protein